MAVSSFRPCPSALALGKVPARQWRTRADVARLLESLRARIESNPAESATNRELANAIGLSEHHLVRLFRATYGQSPARYRSEIRLQTARRRIQAGDPIGEAALAAGYSSVPSFTRLFVRRFGRSPSTFRALG